MRGSSAVPMLTSFRAGRVMSAAMTATSMTALAGTLARGQRRPQPRPGDRAVTAEGEGHPRGAGHARRWCRRTGPIAEMSRMAVAQLAVHRVGEDVGHPAAADAGVVRLAVRRRWARRRGSTAAGSSHRWRSRRSTARCPWRRPCEAADVSSDRWAEASNPVIVYCVSSRPNGTHEEPVLRASCWSRRCSRSC